MLHKPTLTDSGFTFINWASPSPVFRSRGRAYPPPRRPSLSPPLPSGRTTCSRRLPPPPAACPRRFSRAARAPPAPFTSAELASRSRPAPRPAPQPLQHSRFSPPASRRRAPNEVLPPAPPPARTPEAVPSRPAMIGCLLSNPPLCTRRSWGGPRSGARGATPRTERP